MICEKCWSDAYTRMRELGGSQTDHYHSLLNEREFKPCTPDEAAGIVRCPSHGVMYGWCSDCLRGDTGDGL